jgi:hypothetical protein
MSGCDHVEIVATMMAGKLVGCMLCVVFFFVDFVFPILQMKNVFLKWKKLKAYRFLIRGKRRIVCSIRLIHCLHKFFRNQMVATISYAWPFH